MKTQGEIEAAVCQGIASFEQEFQIDGAVLRELLDLKANPRKLSDEELTGWHHRLFPVVEKAIAWTEDHWPDQTSFAKP